MGMEGRVSLHEIRQEWSLDDLQKALAVLEMKDEIVLAAEGQRALKERER
jgi:hypothetical protein